MDLNDLSGLILPEWFLIETVLFQVVDAKCLNKKTERLTGCLGGTCSSPLQLYLA